MDNAKLRIEWDDSDKKQIEEAKTHYRKAKEAGRKITDLDGNPVSVFKPSLLGFLIQETELKESEVAFSIVDETGDQRLIWDMNDPDQAKEAATTFKKYIDRGWRAYAVDASGNRRRRIYEFDIEKEEVLFEEKSNMQIIANFADAVKKEAVKVITKAEKITNFANTFKEVKMVPRTYPG